MVICLPCHLLLLLESLDIANINTFSQLLHTVTKIGTANTVCVDANGSYAVLCISNKQKVMCSSSSCHHSQITCRHIQQLLTVIESCLTSQEDVLSALLPFATLLQSRGLVPTLSDTPTFQPSHRSRRNIPFNLPDYLSNVLCVSYADRFRLVDGVAQLTPNDLESICCNCSQSAWGNAVFDYDATIVTSNQLFKAKGKVMFVIISTYALYNHSVQVEMFCPQL